jgi:hypothetical protein
VEVVIGIILLIGAFALGHTTADQKAAETRARLEGKEVVASSEAGFVPQGCRYRVNGPVQRDLTVPVQPATAERRGGLQGDEGGVAQ